MTYEPKTYDHLLGTPGFSDQLLKNHFLLYRGYVTNVNKTVEILGELTKDGRSNSPMYAEVQRRLGWEWNGMRLHELYFGNMNKASAPLGEDTSLSENLKRIYGSYEDWESVS